MLAGTFINVPPVGLNRSIINKFREQSEAISVGLQVNRLVPTEFPLATIQH